jgi:hypothetical protein
VGWLRSALLAALLCAPAMAQAQEAWPERQTWRAASSTPTSEAMAPRFAIDGDASTRWGGAFSPGHWLQVDLGRAARVGGVSIRWDSAFAVTYSIQTSRDGERWSDAYQSTDSPGGTEYIGFPPVTARYVRLASSPRTADWGVNVYEFEPLPAEAAPRAEGAAALLSAPANGVRATRPLTVTPPRGRPSAGLEVFWGAERGEAVLEGRIGAGPWRVIARDPAGEGTRSFLAGDDAAAYAQLRLSVARAGDVAPTIARVRVLSPTQVNTPLRRYQLAAERRYGDLFPETMHARQVYWTVVGTPAALRKSVIDEWGDVEAFKGAPMVQPLWRDSAGAAAAYGRPIEHGLREGWMPMPWLRWTPRPDVEIRTEAIATEGPVTWVRHRIANRGAARVEGRFSLLVRPIQVNPPWQNGGLSPIPSIAVEDENGRRSVHIAGRRLFVSLTPTSAVGAAPFGIFGESEISRLAAQGATPGAARADDPHGLAGGVLSYDVRLAPGEAKDIVIAFPLGETAPALPEGGYDALADAVAAQWQARLGRIAIRLPDESLVNMLRAQAAYMLLNQSGPALQPGPRNYDRSFIRDGAATASVLLRMGETRTARDYLHWYASHAVHENGLVSPILNTDGSVNRGFGADLEHDSQGEFIWLVAQVARLDGGPESVREYQDEVARALRFLQELRERTLAPGYMDGAPAPERFRGILAPSISHEGYATPTHSNWDNFWGLVGWRDGAWLARAWGDEATARWADEQYALLHDSLAASIRATMQWRGSDTIPASADLGDPDPTSVSIGIDPAGAQDVMPADALARTFDRYLAEVRHRRDPDALYAYTPYELRNVLTFVRLNRPRDGEELLRHFLEGRRPAAWQGIAEVVNSNPRRAIYIGDMPHTWIGSEYARAIFGMLMHEADDGLELLPGAPPAWVAEGGLQIDGLPTAWGALTMRARREGDELAIELGPGVRADARMRVFWPARTRPRSVTVDGRRMQNFDADGVQLERPFRRLVARW